MKLLYTYLRNYTGLVALALVLATINQVFSLLDPLIFRHVIDQYATRFQEYTTGRVLPRRQPAARRGGRRRLRLARRQELPGLLHQRHHAAAGRAALLRRHPPLARAALLGVRGSAQRRDARPAAEGAHRRREADLRPSINVLFTSLVGIIFVMVYAFSVHWLIAPVYFLTVPAARASSARC